MLSIGLAMLLQAAGVDAREVPVETAVSPTVHEVEDSPVAGDPSDQNTPEQSKLLVPKGTMIAIAVESQIGSKISEAKDFFPIKLVQSVEVDGVTVLPAGIMGEGQVVHAKKGGFAGSAGELVLAARYLEHDGRKIPLRSFRFLEEGDEFPFRGQDNTDLASATSIFLAPLGLLIGGGNTVIEPGTIATAKLRANEAFAIAPEHAPQRPAQQPEPVDAGEIDSPTESSLKTKD